MGKTETGAVGRLSHSRTVGAGLAALGAFLAVVAFYAWTLESARGDLSVGENKRDYYNLLVDGFQAGHLHMKTEVDPGLLALPPAQRPGKAPYLLDASLYAGRYYLYFGVVPAVLLHWPFTAITGRDLPDALAVLVLAVAALAVGCLWWRDLRRHLWPALGARWDWLVILALGFGTAVPAVLRRPLFYEEAALSGWLFGAVMLWALLRAQLARGRGIGWLILSGIACGLAVGSRANLVLAGLATLAVGAWLAGRRESGGRQQGVISSLVAAGVGALVVGLGLAAYNYARFGSVVEFGHSFQLGHSPDQLFRLTNLAHNLGQYYGQPPELSAYFPYALPPAEGAKPVDYIGRESVHGEWLWLLAAATAAPAPLLAGRSGLVRILPMVLWFAGNLLVTGLLGARANRYLLDFHPAFVAVVLTGIGWISVARVGRRLWFGLFAGSVLLAAAFNVLASFQVHGFFSGSDPAGYERLGRVCDQAVWRAVPGVLSHVGDQETRLRWPPRGEGGEMLLLSAGVPEFQDRIWVRLDGHGRAACEFQHHDFGSVRGPEFAYQPGAEASLRLSGAFLLPPTWHDWYGDLSADERAALRRRLRLWVDNTLIFDREVPSFPVAPWHLVWGPLWTGVFQVLPPETEWVKGLAGRAGSLRMRVQLPQDRFGSNEPLLQTGTLAAWDVVLIQFTRPGHVRLIHDSAGQGAAMSEELAVDYDAAHTVEIEGPATHDPLTWNRHDTLEVPAVAHLAVRWNGQVVLHSPLKPHPASPASVSVGVNDFASAGRASYAAEIEVGPFLAPVISAPAAAWAGPPEMLRALIGERGVLLHWQREDGRRAAVVWRRLPATAEWQLGWADDGEVQWAAPANADQPDGLRFELTPTDRAEAQLMPFRLSQGGRELIAGHTDFFAVRLIEARALAGESWSISPMAGMPASSMQAEGMPGRIRLHLALPAGGLRESAPLVVMGRSGQADALFLRPVGPDTYVLGLDHWGAPARESRPLQLTPGKQFELVAEVGSLFDGSGFPRDQVRVLLDGEPVLDVRTSLHPVRLGEIWIGQNPLGFSTCAERFSGEIFSVRWRVR